MAYRWTFGKDPLKLEKILWAIDSYIWYNDYGVTMDLQKKSFIKTAESCPHSFKFTLWKELGRLVQRYRIAI